ncbi:MAG: hypothetical protein ACRENQ_12310 [Gemmatimonadaceae bacterium]
MTSDCAVYDAGERVQQRARVALGLAGLGLVALAAMASSAGAQTGGGRGYLFGIPDATFTFKTGYDRAFANSDLFSFSRSEFTLNHSDFSSPMIGTDFGFRLSPRVDAVLGIGYSHSAVESEYRDFVDNNNLPINQTTEFTRVPLTVNLKAYLTPRGRAIGRYVWIPARFAPYVGIGAGTMWYKFRQGGDFIDSSTGDVSSDALATSAWTPMADAFVGGDMNINQGMALTAEARYSWAQGPVSGDFSGFHRADLSGVALTLGITFRY